MRKLIALAVLATASLCAQGLNGTWNGQVNRADGTKLWDVVLQLTQEGDAIKGRIGRSADETATIENAKLENGKLAFDVPTDETTYKVTVDVQGEKLKGSVVSVRDGATSQAMPLELTKSAQ